MINTKPSLKPKLSLSWIFWLVVIACTAVAERLLVVMFYQPVSYSDTPSYRRLAETVLQGFTNYDGTRTPGYPVFLALTGTDHRAWLVQLALGFIATLLLFYIGWKLTDKPWFGGLVALAHTLNLGQLFFESNLLTESLTAFLLILTMAGVLVWIMYPRLRSMWLALLLGMASSITLLVRPLFIYLPFFLLVFLWLEARSHLTAGLKAETTPDPSKIVSSSHHFWRVGVAFIAPIVFFLGGWVTFIHTQFNEWSLTTMTGYHLVQHTGSYFEYVPDEYASIRDTYIKYRDEHIARFGTQTNAIWDAIPEMSKVSGYSFYGLSRVLTRISIQLILHHPLLFIKSALSGWWMFWRAPFYWSAEAVKLPALIPALNTFILLERIALILINLLFIVTTIYFVISEIVYAVRRKPSPITRYFPNPRLYAFMWMLLVNIWIASILQTLLDHGDNPRFLVPMQSLVVLWIGLFVWLMATNRRIQSSTQANHNNATLSQ